MDVQTWSNNKGDGCYFHVRESGSQLKIQSSSKKSPSCKIRKERTIDLKQFECVAKSYNSYVNEDKEISKGIRPNIRDNCGFNTSYIISLIHAFSEDQKDPQK
jgi:hypothetical protein